MVQIVGHWVVRSVDEEPLDEVTLRVEFQADGTYHVIGPCHRSRGQYFRTERGARLQPVELVEEFDCSSVGREVTRRIRAAVQNCGRAGLRDEDRQLVLYERAGRPRLILERDPDPPAAASQPETADDSESDA